MAEYVGSGPYYADASTAGLGTNNKAIVNAAPANNTNTKVTTASGTATWYQLIPNTTNSTTAGTGSFPTSPGTDKGWDFSSANLDATAAAPGGLPARRVAFTNTSIVFDFTVSYSGITPSNTYHIRWYKRGTAGALTLLGSNTSAASSSTTTSFSLGVTIPVTTLLAGESLYFELWYKGADVVSGTIRQTVTLTTGASSDITNLVLGYEYPRSYLVTMVGVASKLLKVGTTLSVAGVGIASILKYVKTSIATTSVGVATDSLYVKPNPLSSVMSGIASKMNTIKPVPYSIYTVGNASVSRKTYKSFLATAVGVPAFSRMINAYLAFSATMVGNAQFNRSIIAVRQFVGTMVGAPSMFVNFNVNILNRITGGGGTVIKKIIAIFDD